MDISNLIDDIKIFSCQASDILLYYSTLLENSDHKNKSSIIEKIISGEHQMSVAYAEPNIGYKFFDCYASTSVSNNILSLNGTKSLVLNAGNANQFIVLAKHEGLSALIMVDAEVDGLSIQSFKTIDDLVEQLHQLFS